MTDRQPMLPAPDRKRHRPRPLPPGYHAQPVRGFRDRTGRVGWEFFRVYGRARDHDRHSSLRYQADELSYWCVTWPISTDDGHTQLAGRSLCYAEHREASDSHPSFARFFALSPEELSVLLPPGDDGERR